MFASEIVISEPHALTKEEAIKQSYRWRDQERKEVPKAYRKVGQPVVIPGSMSTASYLLVGASSGKISMGSSNHGAGRVMSRHAALQKFKGETIKQELHDQNIELRSRGLKGIAEEAPGVYKDVDEVIRVTDGAGIGKKVVRVTPLAVIKG